MGNTTAGDTDLVPTNVLKDSRNEFEVFDNDGLFQFRPRVRESLLMKSKVKKMRMAKRGRIDGPFTYMESEFLRSVLNSGDAA